MIIRIILVALLIGISAASAQNFGAPHGDAGLYYSDRAAWEAKHRDESKTGASPYQPYGAGKARPADWDERHGCLPGPYGCVMPSGKEK